jgi:HSP20 family protein
MLTTHRHYDPFASLFGPLFEPDRFVSMEWDSKETEDAFIVELVAPGVSREDLDVQVEGKTLTVKGQRRTLRSDQMNRFEKSWTIPDGADKDAIAAEMADGIITLTLPKAPQAKPRQIEVKPRLRELTG